MGKVRLEAYRVLGKLLVMRGYTWISGNGTEKRIYVGALRRYSPQDLEPVRMWDE